MTAPHAAHAVMALSRACNDFVATCRGAAMAGPVCQPASRSLTPHRTTEIPMQYKALVAAVAIALGTTSFQAHAADGSEGPSSGSSTERDRQIEDLKAQLAQLQAQVAELEERTDAQSDINVSTQQNVEKLQTSSTTTDALAKLINDTSISGKIYVDMTHVEQTANGNSTNASGTGMDVKRFYLSVSHKFDDVWSANLTTDFNYVSNDGETNLFVKKAYVQGKFSDALVFRAGSADLPWVPFVENYYGFRYVENTLIDRLKFGTSADWGLHLGGTLGQNGRFNYATSVVNGAGYKNPGRGKGMDFEGRVGFSPIKNTIIAVGGYSGTLGKETELVDAQHTASRTDFIAAYANDRTRFGVEYFRANNWNNVLSSASDDADGYSVWGSIGLGDKMSLFARYDSANPSNDLNPSLEDTYYNLGLEFPVRKGFKISTVYKHESLDDDGAIDIDTDEFGVWGEVAF
jgi:hypothetical protein